MLWWPRQTPRMGIARARLGYPFRPQARAISSRQTPASFGAAPGARRREEPPLPAEERPDGDRQLDVARSREPAYGAAVRAALHAFELVDDLQRADLRRSGERPRRERRRERVHRGEPGL